MDETESDQGSVSMEEKTKQGHEDTEFGVENNSKDAAKRSKNDDDTMVVTNEENVNSDEDLIEVNDSSDSSDSRDKDIIDTVDEVNDDFPFDEEGESEDSEDDVYNGANDEEQLLGSFEFTREARMS